MTFYRVRPRGGGSAGWRRWTWAEVLLGSVAFPVGVVARQPGVGLVDVALVTALFGLLVLAAAGQR